jgi:hypothetical protein
VAGLWYHLATGKELFEKDPLGDQGLDQDSNYDDH